MIDDDELTHEVQETACVWVGVACRYLCPVSHVDPYLDVVLAPLFKIISLQVVNDGKVVDVATAAGDITMLVVTILFSKLPNEFL